MHGRVARQERADLDAERRERARQSPDHIGEAAGLDQRKDFRGDRQDAQIAHAARSEPIDHRLGDQADALVGAAEPLAHRAPDPRRPPDPSGMCTPRSMMTLLQARAAADLDVRQDHRVASTLA